MVTIYGIKNCDTVKKAIKLLESNNTEYDFVDFKKEGVTKTKVLNWKKAVGDWPINKRGTTFRKIKDQWENANDEHKLMLIVNNSSLIKRPVLEYKNKVVLGFDQELYDSL